MLTLRFTTGHGDYGIAPGLDKLGGAEEARGNKGVGSLPYSAELVVRRPV